MNINDGRLVSETDRCKCYEFNDCDMVNFEITARDIGRDFFVARRENDNDDSYFVYTTGLRGQRCTILDVDEVSGTVTISKHSFDEVEIHKNGISNDSILRGDSWDDFGCWASDPLPERVIWLIKIERLKRRKLAELSKELLLSKEQEILELINSKETKGTL